MIEVYELVLGYAKSAWRFRWLALAAAWIICLTGWAYVAFMPDVYQANTRIYVDTSSELRRLLGDQIVQSDVSDHLAYVRERMLGGVQLARVAQETGLDANVQSAADKERLLFFLARQVSISGGAVDHRGRGDNIFTISYEHENREKAIEVVDALLNAFVDDLLNARRNQSDAAGKFLRAQISDYEQRLQAAEEKLADFNRRNFDRLPDLQSGYFELMQAATAERDETQKELRLALSRLQSIESQSEGESPRTLNMDEIDPNSIEGRIYTIEARLSELLLRFTDNHPDVVAAREMLAQLNSQKQQAYDDAKGDHGSSATVNNPVLQALLIARNEARAEVATLRVDLEERTAKVARLRALLDETPEVEAELARLNRDYDVVNERYQSLLASLERDQLSRQVLLSEQVDFRVIDPPSSSLDPVAPRRGILILLVFTLACSAGAGAALLFSQLRPVFQSVVPLQQRFDMPIIGTVQALAGGSHSASSLIVYGLSVSALCMALVSVMALETLGPGMRGVIPSF